MAFNFMMLSMNILRVCYHSLNFLLVLMTLVVCTLSLCRMDWTSDPVTLKARQAVTI